MPHLFTQQISRVVTMAVADQGLGERTWPWSCLHRLIGDLSLEEVKGATPLGSHVSLKTSGTLVSLAHDLMLDILSA